MRAVAVLASLLAASALVAAHAQVSAEPPHNNGLAVVHDSDGGVNERLESIVITPKAHAPFTAQLQTEWVRTLADGGTITVVNERRIARDSSGRVYQERWFLVPKNERDKSKMTAIQISDPSNHTLYTCFMLDGRHTCHKTIYTPSTSTVFKMEGPPTGPLPNGNGYAAHENLGNQSMAGVDTVGTKESITFNPGVFGNDSQMVVEREFWYSPQLDINLLSKRSDPRFGAKTFTITDLDLSEPQADLFKLPAGFKSVDGGSGGLRAVDRGAGQPNPAN